MITPRIATVVLLTLALCPPLVGAEKLDPEGVAFFEKRIRPLLVKHCYSCHSAAPGAKIRGDLRLDTRAGVRQGGTSGPVLVPGEPEKSPLIHAVRYTDDRKMPPKTPLSKAEVADLERWVKMGAPDPRDGKPIVGIDLEKGRQWWSFRPVAKVSPPAVRDADWPINDVDRFIRAEQEKRGLKPAGLADRRTLLRRVSYDLTGLPPTPKEIDAFLADRSPTAYERVVERLLASSAYGERWGRHWLDVVRYADTAGDNSDYPVPQLYKYRNWVIDAFNADVPYDRFVREQLAGDLISGGTDAERRDRVIATGYLANTHRFGSYEDARYQWYLTYEDSIDNLGRTFLGLTMGCARCHDHKFDPLPTTDYYALYGFFASTRYPWPGIELDKAPHDLVPLGSPKELAYAVAEGRTKGNKKVGNAHVQLKGDPERLGAEVPRRFPLILGGQTLPPNTQGSGRLYLAKWLTEPTNPLIARVLVNRVWQGHFGRGIVATPNDFGKMGQPPTHPELLDYLAGRFIAEGWSIKSLHRLIVLSRTYQLASTDDEANASIDVGNSYLWHFPRHRLDAESIRDTLLSLGGNLDRSVGGPHPFPPVSSWNFTQHNPFKAVYDTNRRSVYLMTQRIQRHPFLALFDGPDTNASTARRITSTTPLQGLFLMNDPFVHEQAKRFAARLLAAAKDDGARIDQAYALAFGRAPTTEERSAITQHLDRVREKLKGDTTKAWESVARALFLSNEFVYVD